MNTERTVEFAYRGLISQLSEVEWPVGLPMPTQPNLPRGCHVVEMPNTHHKGIAQDLNGENYHCTLGSEGYEWRIAS